MLAFTCFFLPRVTSPFSDSYIVVTPSPTSEYVDVLTKFIYLSTSILTCELILDGHINTPYWTDIPS